MLEAGTDRLTEKGRETLRNREREKERERERERERWGRCLEKKQKQQF